MDVSKITEGIRGDHPHAMVIECFLYLYTRCVEWDCDNILVERIMLSVESLLEKDGPEPYFKGAACVEGFPFWLEGEWLEPGYPEEPNVNYIEPFQKHSKYIACSYDDYFQYWSENIGRPEWYTFPAVAYSFEEIQAWFVWSIKRIMPIFPHQHAELTALMSKYVDVDSAIALLLKKLDGEIPWAFGPARMREPKMLLWHHLIHDKKMNDWIRQWLV